MRISAQSSALLQQPLLSKVVNSFFVSEAKDTLFTSNRLQEELRGRLEQLVEK